MLVVSRKIGQSIHIGDNIVIHFIEKTGTHSIRVGIEAPRELKVLRSELIRKENLHNNTFDDKTSHIS